MCTNRPKIAVLVVLAGYVPALTLGGWFHSHRPPHGPSACAHRAEGLSQAPVCCSDSRSFHEDAVAAGGASTSCGLETCLVCRFLGQKLAPLACGAEAASTPLEEQLTRLRPIPPLQGSIHATHVRGPPQVAWLFWCARISSGMLLRGAQ